MFRVLRFVAAFALAGTIAACSTADFSQPINALASATSEASKSFAGYADELQKRKQSQNLSDLSVNPDRLVVVGCKRTSTKCELRMALGAGASEPLKPEFLVHTRQIMAGIVTYAANLQEIASADDITKLKAASDAIPADVVNLAKAADELSAQTSRPTKFAARISPFSAPVGEIVTIALTQYAEFEKLRALRSATKRMNLIFVQAMAVLSTVVVSNQELLKTPLLRKYQDAREAYYASLGAMRNKLKENPPPKDFDNQLADAQAALRDALEKYSEAADNYNAALTAKPQAAFAKLAEAHLALVKALQTPEPDFQTVFQKLREFEQIATTVATDVKKINEALHPRPASS